MSDPVASPGIPTRPIVAFTQTLLAEVRKVEGLSVIGTTELREMLAIERQRQDAGCQADQECIAEIAGALGVDEMVTSEIELTRNAYTVTVRRIDARRPACSRPTSARFERRDGEELLAIIGDSVGALYRGAPLRPGRTRGVEKEFVKRRNPPPLPRPVFGVSGAGFAAAALAGGVALYLRSDARSQYYDLFKGVPSSGQVSLASDKVNARTLAAQVSFAAALALLVALAIEVPFTDWRDDRSAFKASPAVARSGGGVELSGRF